MSDESSSIPMTRAWSLSAECKAIAEFANFCFVLGLPTRDGKLPFAGRKHRRTAELEPIVLQLRGDLAKIEDTRGEWVFDERTKSIVERSESNIFYGSLSSGNGNGNRRTRSRIRCARRAVIRSRKR